MTHKLVGTENLSLLREELLPDIFAASVQRNPLATAIICGEQSFTYAELDARANRVAQALQARGVGRGSFVGLWLTRSLELHVALLGILKAGAAYLPFDSDVPAERVAECLVDCAAVAIVMDCAIAARAGYMPVPSFKLSDLLSAATTDTAPDLRAQGCSNTDPAYAIYTSGSTGKPKGIVITHRNICHYLRAANTVYGLCATDVVFQGASVAFDLSLEEIFVPYLVGATLWVATRATLQETDRLAEVMIAAGITVLDTVPTLLALLPQDIPSLRVIILGGEMCPTAIAERWCRPQRQIFNSYGPTEATVVATIAEIRVGQPVTIGKPIPNYTCYVVGDALQPVAEGVTGELLIGGPGVATGYLNRDALTAEKFIANPFDSSGIDPLLYRTGDAVSIDANGCLLFNGRFDDQIKIRGFRVELGEIEARLCAYPGVAQAAVVLRRDIGIERLAAFVVYQAHATLEHTALRNFLAEQLPVYMVPSHIEPIDALPIMISGKTDRRALQALPLSVMDTGVAQEEPRTVTEAALLAAAQPLFPDQAIAFDADMFLDLGGHSLIAAQFVSAVRNTPALAGLTLHDVYDARTLRAMATLLDHRAPSAAEAERQANRSLAFTPPPLLRRFICGVAQAAALPLILSLYTARWLGVFMVYRFFSGEEQHLLATISMLLMTYTVLNLATIGIAILAKWLVIGRTKPGRYPLWGVYYYRWWLSQRFTGAVRIKWFQYTPVMGWFLRALGAKVGSDVVMRDYEAGAIDLVSIGNGCSIGSKILFANANATGDELIIGTINIHDDVNIGSSCVIGSDVTIGEGVELAALTSLPTGAAVNRDEKWEGSPGRKVGMIDTAALPAKATASGTRKNMFNVIYVVMLLLLPPITLLPIIPAFYLLDYLRGITGKLSPLAELCLLPLVTWPTAMVLIAVTVLLIASIRWAVLPRITAGICSIYSGLYVRNWVVVLATELTLEILSSLYTTLYMRQWYRLMGARIGKATEISASLSARYDLIDIGDYSFIADNVVLGDETIRRGWMASGPVTTGARVFVGNDAVIAPGTSIPANTLIGVKSTSPANSVMAENDTWFGSPSFKLPVRQRFAADIALTFTPSCWRQTGRGLFETFTVSMPIMLFIVFGTLTIEALTPIMQDGNYSWAALLFMAASVAIFVGMVLAAAGMKWLLIGAYQPTARMMWSWWALRTEAIAVMYYGMAAQGLLMHLRGTPLLPWFLRLFGTHVGRGVFMDTADLTEFDCVTIGDYAVINKGGALQTHLYEDRVMKVGRILIGQGVIVDCGATILYDTYIGDYAQIGQLTLVMKGESIPAHTGWHGSPAVTC